MVPPPGHKPPTTVPPRDSRWVEADDVFDAPRTGSVASGARGLPRPSQASTLVEHDSEITQQCRIDARNLRTRIEVPTLRVVAGRDMLSYVTLHGVDEVILGRDEAASMVLTDALVSRRHARVVVQEDLTVVIYDLGSTIGTSVNGQPVSRAVIRPGDQIEVGGVSLRLEMLSMEEISHLSNVISRLKLQNRDPLTGLLTRGWIDEDLPALMERASRGEPLSCIFFDIDRFKEVNDTFGHHIGDDVLVGCSRLMLYDVRDQDACVRYGGEEILMFLHNAPLSGAADVADRIRQAVEAHDWSRTAPGLKATISAGVAEWRTGEAAREWMARADKALLRANREGRNRVLTSEG